MAQPNKDKMNKIKDVLKTGVIKRKLLKQWRFGGLIGASIILLGLIMSFFEEVKDASLIVIAIGACMLLIYTFLWASSNFD